MLLDTSGLLCLIHLDEPQHEEAKRLYRSAPARFTHNHVLSEFVALVHARKLPRHEALDLSASLLESANVEVVWVDEPLHRRALDLLEARLDKTYSLCDAASFVLLRERGATEAPVIGFGQNFPKCRHQFQIRAEIEDAELCFQRARTRKSRHRPEPPS